MKTEQVHWTAAAGWEPHKPQNLGKRAQLALIFGNAALLQRPDLRDEIRKGYPAAILLGCSTAGEIFTDQVSDDTLVVTAVEFEKTQIRGLELELNDVENSFEAGRKLAGQLPKQDLVHILVLSDGLKINGSELVAGLIDNLPENVTVTGGLAGDGDRFGSTFVMLNEIPKQGSVAVLGLYGKNLKVGYGSLGGWDPFGPERLITRSKKNVLYELDGQSALDLYKKYLGEHAKDLPASGLLFPLSLRMQDNALPLVRTILAINEEEQSMTFAGNVPEGAYAWLMKANFDRIIDGATGAAKISAEPLGSKQAELALLISCVGRKLVLKQRIEEEIEGVREVLGKTAVITGFYSYGEISPFTTNAKCELHNQTMTITTFLEN